MTLIIDDSNWQQQVDAADAAGVGRGLQPRDFNAAPEGFCSAAPSFDFPLIPRSEWSARIKERQERGQTLSGLMKLLKIPSLDQGQTNYCWVNGPVTGIYAIRAQMGLPHVDLSPASVAAPIKNFSNQGGWGLQAIEWIATKGVCRASLWPANAISRQYFTENAKADAATRLVSEWRDLPRRSFDAVMTALLLGFPVPAGYNWWSHEICLLDPVEIESGRFGALGRNSWGPSYGDDGFFTLAENKATPDDAQCLTVTSANPE